MTDDPGLRAIHFEADPAEQARQRSRFRRLVLKALAACLGTGLTICVFFNVFSQLSMARSSIWPNPLSARKISFTEPDPVLQAFVRNGFCDDSPGTEGAQCRFTRALANDKHAEALHALYPLSGDDLGAAKELLLDQLRDSAGRHDWATCAAYSRLTLALLNAKREDLLVHRSINNQLWLLSVACENPAAIYTAQAAYVKLIESILHGTHLASAESGRAAEDDDDSSLLSSWNAYLTGLNLLRQAKFDAAAASFRRVDEQSGNLAELALIGLARAAFWKLLVARQRGAATPELQRTTLERLNLALQRCRVANFRDDIGYYIDQAKP
ncbi:hypothetical protein AcdelDRAFT_0002 [Acidovorax delafieldii 2AN]|uniref:Uncharacterized protein n=1 Tax=Acidovorax delafieldii 2AN TaxID=573060 RepID=C5SZC2_ACIDE|nr:hypothetical protein [Acidovorax delafieldii]EER62318.1 hypothetical protein AcdelDRAFT_0002 [Acidovorax delafieldii 2AN]